VLRGLELHEYLKANIAVPNTRNDILVPQGTPPNIKINGILPSMKERYKVLQNLNARVVGAALNYGAWLNADYLLWLQPFDWGIYRSFKSARNEEMKTYTRSFAGRKLEKKDFFWCLAQLSVAQ